MQTNEQPNLDNEEMKMPTQSPGINVTTPIEEHNGLIIGLLLAGLAIILIGLYLWFQASQMVPPAIVEEPVRPTPEMNQEPESTTAKAQTESYTTVSTSDEMGAIEADLESTDFGSLETEFTQIEAEIEGESSPQPQ